MNIRCRKVDCVHNKSATCTAPDVTVFRCAACGTYKEDQAKKKMLKSDPSIFELAEELAPTIPNNVPLSCAAGICLFNCGGRCNANGIAVINNDERKRADCATFIER